MSFYVLAHDGKVEIFPYTLTDMRIAHPETSFPADIPDELAAAFDVFPVKDTAPPTINPDTQELAWAAPTFKDGVWTQQWAVRDFTPDEIAERKALWRASAVVSPFQGRSALLNAGLLDRVEEMMAAANTDRQTKLAWEYASEWRRTSALIGSIAAKFKLTDDAVDDLFRYGMAVVA